MSYSEELRREKTGRLHVKPERSERAVIDRKARKMIRVRSSITVKIGLLVLGSTCLVLALVLERSYTNSRELIRQEAETSARNLVSALANEIEQEFLVVARAAEDLASFLETGQWDEQTLPNQIKRMVRRNPRIFGSTVAFQPFAFKPGVERYAPYFYKSQGGIKFKQLGTADYDYFNKDWFKVTKRLKIPVWSQPYLDEGGGDIVMCTYSCPMFRKRKDGSGERLAAVVTVDISLKRLNDLVNAKRLYESGFCSVISDKGIFVTNRVPERVMRMSVMDVARTLNHPRGIEIAGAIIAKPAGFEDIDTAITGVDSFIAFTLIDPPGWKLTAVLPKGEMFAKVATLHHETIMLAGLGIVLLLLAAVLVARSIGRPLRRMASETVKVADGDLDVDFSDIRSTDEVGQLARAFTRMTEGLKDRERIKDTFGRYLTQEVVKRLLESKDGLKLGGEIREISMMMSDLRGFTALSSTMDPEQVIRFLNRYLGKMVEIILDYRGIIDEIIGDGILSFFGAPEPLEDHSAQAVACALTMQAAMEEVNAANEKDGLPRLEMGVAVNTGEVVVGNIGSEKRTKYGAVGSQVNFTGRVESFTLGGQVLITRSTYEKLQDILRVRKVLEVEMKGMSGKVELYDITGIGEPYNVYLTEKDETLVPVKEKIDIQVYRLDEKVVTGSGTAARITHISPSSAKVVLPEELSRWENVRFQLLNEQLDPEPGAVYAKVISVTRVDDGHEAEIHFTSVSPEADKVFRDACGSA